jgi:uncharacterized protein YjbI with pentapeptide repeats
MSRARFTNTEFRAARLENCNLDGAVFEGCDLRGTRFVGTEPQKAQLLLCRESPTS